MPPESGLAERLGVHMGAKNADMRRILTYACSIVPRCASIMVTSCRKLTGLLR